MTKKMIERLRNYTGHGCGVISKNGRNRNTPNISLAVILAFSGCLAIGLPIQQQIYGSQARRGSQMARIDAASVDADRLTGRIVSAF